MALTLQDQVNVWLKAEARLSDLGASKVAQDAFRALRERLVSAGIQLQYIAFSDATAGDPGICQNTGYSPVGVPCTVYGLYARNRGAGDGTDSFISLHNAADNASAPLVTAVIQDDNDEFIAIKYNGWTFGTDLTISGANSAGGATESAAANAAVGFVIIGA